MEDLEGKLVELIEKFENLSGELAPGVVDVALTTAWAQALQTLLIPMFFMFIGLGVFLVGRAIGKMVAAEEENEAKAEEYREVGVILGGFFGGVIAIMAAGFLINPIAWMSLADPRLWIAKQVLGW